MQVTKAAQLHLEAKVKAVPVLQDVGAHPVPNTEHPTVIQSSSLEKPKQKGCCCSRNPANNLV